MIFTVLHYRGSVNRVHSSIKRMVVEADSIDKVNFIDILEDEVAHYWRAILWTETLRTIDYGSYYKFIAIAEGDKTEEEIKEELENDK